MTVSILSIHQARDSKLKLIKLSAGKEDPVYNLCAKRSARIEIRSDDDDDPTHKPGHKVDYSKAMKS